MSCTPGVKPLVISIIIRKLTAQQMELFRLFRYESQNSGGAIQSSCLGFDNLFNYVFVFAGLSVYHIPVSVHPSMAGGCVDVGHA